MSDRRRLTDDEVKFLANPGDLKFDLAKVRERLLLMQERVGDDPELALTRVAVTELLNAIVDAQTCADVLSEYVKRDLKLDWPNA